MGSSLVIPNPSAAPYSATAAYLTGEFAIGSDGNIYTAVQATTGNTPTTDAGTNWILARVTNSVTLNIASRFSTFALAWAFLKQAYIDATAFVTIQFSDATYAMGASPYVLNHPCGSRIKILGNVTTPANVVLNCTMPAQTNGAYFQNNWGMFSVHSGNSIGLIDGFTMNAGSLHYGVIALLAFDGATIVTGSHLVIQNFYAGVAAFIGSRVDCDGITVSGGGDGNIFAYMSSTISFKNGTSTGAGGFFAQSGILAEFGSSVLAYGCTLSGNGLAPVQLNWGSSINMDTATISRPSQGPSVAMNGLNFVQENGVTNGSNVDQRGACRIIADPIYNRFTFGLTYFGGLGNFDSFQFIGRQGDDTFYSITEDNVASAFWGFKASSNVMHVSSEGPTISFQVSTARNTMGAGTEALKLTATKATVVKLNISAIPTSSSGLSSGDVYSNAGILTIVP